MFRVMKDWMLGEYIDGLWCEKNGWDVVRFEVVRGILKMCGVVKEMNGWGYWMSSDGRIGGKELS